ncbi:MAG TPA: metal-dependent hydrolase [Flavobacteriales bacterium]|nr:metal-dependent hydrolase [Flavobacteriales bacterium]
MDSLSQIVLGAACGQAAAGKQLGNKALFWGAIGGTIPDLDTFLTPFFDNVTALLVHRGYTHSMFFSFVVAPILASILYKFNKTVKWRTWFFLFFFSLLTHPLLDIFTGYGTPLFLPFSDFRVDINSIFIIDPVYTLIYIFCLIAVMRAGKDHVKRTKWNNRGIILSTSYLLFTLLNQSIHNKIFKEELDKQKIEYTQSFAAPTAFNQILFYNVTIAKDGYYLGYHSWFDSKPPMFTFYPKNDSLLPAVFHTEPRILKLKYFSKNMYCFEKQPDGLYFCDVRFGKMSGFYEEAPWVFRWKLIFNEKKNTLKIEKGNWSFSRFKALGKLWVRIKGN